MIKRTSIKRSIYQAAFVHIVHHFSNNCIFSTFRFQGHYNIQRFIPHIYINYINFIIRCKFQTSYSVVQRPDGKQYCVGQCKVSLRPLIFERTIDTVRYSSTFIIDTIQRWLKLLSVTACTRTRKILMARRKKAMQVVFGMFRRQSCVQCKESR